MNRLTIDPSLQECPDYQSETYTESRAPLISGDTTEAQAVQFLRTIWIAGNNADKTRWAAQLQNDENERAHHLRLNDERVAQLEEVQRIEKEDAQKEEIKKNKAKYTPLVDRDVPTEPPVVASLYATRRVDKGLYVEMYHWTNAGLQEALRTLPAVDDESMTMIHLADGTSTFVPAAAARDKKVIADKDLSFEDFCQAIPRYLDALETANTPLDKVDMLATFWASIQVHKYRSSLDPIDTKALLVYAGEQRILWYAAQANIDTTKHYVLTRINTALLEITRERVYREERSAIDRRNDYLVRKLS